MVITFCGLSDLPRPIHPPRKDELKLNTYSSIKQQLPGINFGCIFSSTDFENCPLSYITVRNILERTMIYPMAGPLLRNLWRGTWTGIGRYTPRLTNKAQDSIIQSNAKHLQSTVQSNFHYQLFIQKETLKADLAPG